MNYQIIKKDLVKCIHCGYENKYCTKNLTNRFYNCPICSDIGSIPERIFRNLLETKKIEYEKEKTFLNLEGKRFDFYLKDLNLVVEIHGSQHYEENKLYGTLENQQINDKIKKDFILNNNINYVEINCSNSNFLFLKTNIIAAMKHYLDLNDANWEQIFNISSKSVIRDSWKLWNDGFLLNEICDKLNISRGTCIEYLKKGAFISKCDYSEENARKRAGIYNGINQGRPLLVYNMSKELIGEYNSALEALEALGLDSSVKGNIPSVCNGIRKSAGGYIWEYKNKDDAKIKSNSPVAQYDLEWNFIKNFDTIKEAAIEVNLKTHKSIAAACRSGKTARGFRWKYIK